MWKSFFFCCLFYFRIGRICLEQQRGRTETGPRISPRQFSLASIRFVSALFWVRVQNVGHVCLDRIIRFRFRTCDAFFFWQQLYILLVQ